MTTPAASLNAAADVLHAAVFDRDPSALARLMTTDVALALVEVLNERAYLARVGDPAFKPEAATDYEVARLATAVLAAR
ncbi:hypothetical protein ACIQGZ_17420 [Streptomyces sp. NPDC092296]|uniref:hypothetical protein n=1 Tax=Streptomyces sp. NPDC092296 TaxID=3366012 RepID=UPI00381406C8